MDREVLDLHPDAESLLRDSLFQGLDLSEGASLAGLYRSALEMERRTRDHFRDLAGTLPEGLEKDLCLELASEEEEHIAMLETELDQVE